MKELKLRAQIRFDHEHVGIGINFDRFLPLIENQTPVPLGNTDFRVVVAGDVNQHWGNVSAYRPGGTSTTLGSRLLGMHVFLWSEIEDNLHAELHRGAITDSTRHFGERVLEAIEVVHDAVINFARNEHQQTHLSGRKTSLPELQQRLLAYDTRYEVLDGWKLLKADENNVFLVVSSEPGVTSQDWEHFRQQLSSGRFRVKPYRRLLANAFAHYSRQDFRASIIEAVAAWEMVMNQEVPFCFAQSVIAFKVQDWKNHIEKAGMKASSVLFIAVATHIERLVEGGEHLLAAIDLRNNVIHNGQQKIDNKELMKYLIALRRICFACDEAANLYRARLNVENSTL